MQSAERTRPLTSKEAAEMMGMSEGHLRRLRTTGGDCPRHYKLGRSVRYRPGVVQKWIEDHEVASV